MSITEILSLPKEQTTGKKRGAKESSDYVFGAPPTKRLKTSGTVGTIGTRNKKFEKVVEKSNNKKRSFVKLGLCREVRIGINNLGWKKPTAIQIDAIPHIMLGRDIIALAETGSGKTGAFAIPILEKLLNAPQAYHSIVLSPTRELALQISKEFENLGKQVNIKVLSLIGGVDRTLQQLKLQASKPHVIVGTPGRILDHLINYKGFENHLKNLKVLVLDEADMMLQSGFEESVTGIINCIRKSKGLMMNNEKRKDNEKCKDNENEMKNEMKNEYEYQTLLFSATMTNKVERLEKASLREGDTIKLQVNNKYRTVNSLDQKYLFIPAKHKLVYLTYLLNCEFNNRNLIIFCNSIKSVHHLSLVLHNLDFGVVPIHGEMTQYERIGAIEKFEKGNKSIIIATDVLSRGLDISSVSIVINYDIPICIKDYIHRVGRTARAGKKGLALNIVTQYDVEMFQRIEERVMNSNDSNDSNDCKKVKLNEKMQLYPNVTNDKVMLLIERVMKADRYAISQMKEHQIEMKEKLSGKSKRNNGGNGGNGGNDEDEEDIGPDASLFDMDSKPLSNSKSKHKKFGNKKSRHFGPKRK